jgi:hypothetical protein
LINHVRTLLLNRPASAATPFGEYVPPDFATVAVPGAVQRARNFLFGANPDAMMLDYRLRQYMAMLHATELVEFVVAQDQRITYIPGGRDMADFSPAPVVAPVVGGQVLFLGGTRPMAPDGRMTYAWQVQVPVASVPAAAVAQRSPAYNTVDYPIAYTGGLSSEFPLTGSPLVASFHSAGIVDGTTWNVGCLALPARDPGQVAADLDALGANVVPFLFGAAAEEPWLTWQNLWNSNQPLAYRLGAVLLAVAARTDEARTRTG